MSLTTHMYEVFIRAPRERVWQALVDPGDTVRSFHGTRFESTFDATATATATATAVDGDWHRAQAVTANNSTWEYLDGRTYTDDDADELLQHADAAADHWKRATGSTAANTARASWMISRAHVVLGHGDLALQHADRSISFADQAGPLAADFDHGYGYEARARALACLGRLDEATAAYEQALAVSIKDDQDREIFEGDLASEPWYGLVR